jgi:hypothetical protein
MTSARDSLGRAGQWAVERSPVVVDQAVNGLEPLSVGLQSVGTGLNDSGNGWGSVYNWGVALNGASGARTVFLEGKKVFRPHPNDPPDVFAAAIGAAKVAGSVAYGMAPTSTGRAIGAGVQAAALGLDTYRTQARLRAAQQARTPLAQPVPAAPPQVPLPTMPSTLSVDQMWTTATAAVRQPPPPAQQPQNPVAQSTSYLPEGAGTGRGRGQASSQATNVVQRGGDQNTNRNRGGRK